MNKVIQLFLLVICYVQIFATEQNVADTVENVQDQVTYTNFWELTFYSVIIAVGIIAGFFIGRAFVLTKAKREIKNILANKIKSHEIGYSFSKMVYDLNEKIKINNRENMGKRDDYEYDKLQKIIDDLTKSLDNTKFENKHLLSQIRDLEGKLKLIDPNYVSAGTLKEKETPITSNLTSNEKKEVINNPIIRINEPEKHPFIKFNRHIYFSMPESDGSFKITDGESSNDGRMNFRIDYEDSTRQGELFFISSDRDQKAINSLETFLKPVSDIENIASAETASKIHMIEKGRVRLVNDSWVIDPSRKIKIKLY